MGIGIKKGKKGKIKYVLAAFLACTILLAGCAEEGGANAGDMPELVPFEESGDGQAERQVESDTLKVGFTQLEGNFCQFASGLCSSDKAVLELTNAYLVEEGEKGKPGLGIKIGDSDSLAEITVKKGKESGAEVRIELREDIYFSDGVKLTADDLIFSMYAALDPDNDIPSPLSRLKIEGLQDYLEVSMTKAELIYELGVQNEDYTYFTADEQDEFWNVDIQEAGLRFTHDIIEQLASSFAADYSDEFAKCGNNKIAFAMYMWGFGEPDKEAKNIKSFASDAEYEIGLLSEDDFWHEIDRKYGGEYSMMSNQEAYGRSLWDILYEMYPEYAKGIVTSQAQDYISGIDKLGEYAVGLHLTDAETFSPEDLRIPVIPLHYYGDLSKYDYENEKELFGFTKGNLSFLEEKKDAPIGAGPYVYEKLENGKIYLTANNEYYGGKPAISKVELIGTSEGDMLERLVSGDLDIFVDTVWESELENYKNYNSNGELAGDLLDVRILGKAEKTEGTECDVNVINVQRMVLPSTEYGWTYKLDRVTFR